MIKTIEELEQELNEEVKYWESVLDLKIKQGTIWGMYMGLKYAVKKISESKEKINEAKIRL